MLKNSLNKNQTIHWEIWTQDPLITSQCFNWLSCYVRQQDICRSKIWSWNCCHRLFWNQVQYKMELSHINIKQVKVKIPFPRPAYWEIVVNKRFHRILPVNFYLKKINVKTNDQCNFCKNGVETILHVFCLCEKIVRSLEGFQLSYI